MRPSLPLRPVVAAALLAAFASPLPAAATETPIPGPAPRPIPVAVTLVDETADLARLGRLDVDVDAVFDGWLRAYVDAEQLDKLRGLGYRVEPLPDEGLIGLRRLAEEGVTSAASRAGDTRGSVPAQYHDYQSLVSDLQQVAADHPAIVRLSSIGTSVQGRSLWMMKITDNPDVEEDEPEIAYLSSMHGDEVVGKELCFNLIDYLTDNYGTDPRVTSLVDGAEIWILPSLNPDGTALGQRWNASGIDLNRDFPDQFVDAVNTPAGREPETAAVMGWRADRRLVVSANFHGGALVANYPMDSNPSGASVFSPPPAPDLDGFVSLARTYADANVPMSQSNSHPAFDDGITNGADWYSINGGIQDWQYVWYGGFDVTLEVSNVKWPAASELPGFWDDNLESMLAYLERGFEGLRGTVTDAETGLPVDAEIRVDDNQFPAYVDRDVGDWHRYVAPGTYDVTVSADGYQSVTVPSVAVAAGPATALDVEMSPEPPDLQPIAARVVDTGNEALDPGESTPLALTLRNEGRAAAGIQARLVPLSWYVDATQPVAVYPDLAMGASAETLAPYHGVALAPDTPLGHMAGFAVEWSADDGTSGLSDAVFVVVGEPSCTTLTATDLPQTVSAILTAQSDVVATGGGVDIVRPTVEIRHGYIGELTVTLRSPAGTEVVLHNGTGGSADDIVGTYGVDLTPAQPLETFDGEDASGTWSLIVEDAEFINTGTVEAFSLELCSLPAEPSTPEMRFRDGLARPDGALLRWWPYPGVTSYRVYRSSDPSSAGSFADVTAEDADPTDTYFLDASPAPLSYFLVTGVGPAGEGPQGHFGQ